VVSILNTPSNKMSNCIREGLGVLPVP
jgi:hypothetical protein